MKKAYLLFILGLLLPLQALKAQQRFFNLTVDDVTIDSLLPRFSYAIPLSGNFADSVYTLEIRYPEFLDMSRRDTMLYNRLTQEVPPALPAISQQIVVDRKQGRLEFSLTPIVERGGKKQFLVSFMMAVTATPCKRSVRRANAREAAATADRYASHSRLASGRWVKIRVPADNIYELSDGLLRQAGFSDPSRVKIYGYGGHLQNEQLVGAELAETDDLPEVPTCTVNGHRLFYGLGPVSWESPTALKRTRNPYSDYGYYFLTESDGEPLTVDSATFLQTIYPSAADYHSLHEVDNFSWYHGGRNLFERTPIELGASRKYVLTRQCHTSQHAKMQVGVTAGTATTVQVAVGDSIVGTMSIRLSSYDKGSETEKSFDLPLTVGNDTVTITTLTGGPARLDYISMTYDNPSPAPTLTSSFPSPEYVYAILNQDHHADAAADMIIIIPTTQKLLSQAQRLATFHEQTDGLRVRIVPADELYNEFSSGTPDANAYRRYLKMLYDRAQTDADMPRYLLLFGDCLWDNRMLTTDASNLNPDDYLLAFESENSFNEVYCYIDDGWFTLLDDGEGINPQSVDKQDMAVGRFPVTTDSEAKIMVDKIISYKQNANAGAWENTIMFMGDDGNQNLHMRDVDKTAETIASLYPSFDIKKVMWDAYTRVSSSTGNTYPEVSQIIKQQQAQGALIMDYAGHGSEIQISHEAVLKLNDFKQFSNTNLPLWITASCDIMPFDGSTETIGEAAVLNSKGGAVAFYGTTRTVYANYNAVLNTAFLRHVLSLTDGKPTTLGEAQRRAKNDMITTGQDRTTNKLQYSLLGDPALSLNRPTLQVVLDSINGIAVGSETLPVLKAGSIVSVSGHIEQDSLRTTAFDGLVTATVKDTRELITCKMNDPVETTSAFKFYDRQKTLFAGSDSVRAGAFSFRFAVPRDINYADGNGLISLYAVNNDHTLEANGAEDGFYINGSDTVANDSIGPSIYCYLNTPSFVDGSDVNTTPFFYAQISDKDGINASGSGIGHDLQLTIDGDMNKTYVLNDHFAYDFGSYTSGSTYYSIPALEEGAHTLRFRAWDILNNCSQATLHFNVVKGLEPNIASISCTDNPATTQTTFIITHNYVDSNIDVIIDVFDMSGRILWTHEESGMSTGNAYSVTWNLTTDTGARLQTGVYLYRVRVSSEGGSKASKAKKLVVIGNN